MRKTYSCLSSLYKKFSVKNVLNKFFFVALSFQYLGEINLIQTIYIQQCVDTFMSTEKFLSFKWNNFLFHLCLFVSTVHTGCQNKISTPTKWRVKIFAPNILSPAHKKDSKLFFQQLRKRQRVLEIRN